MKVKDIALFSEKGTRVNTFFMKQNFFFSVIFELCDFDETFLDSEFKTVVENDYDILFSIKNYKILRLFILTAVYYLS